MDEAKKTVMKRSKEIAEVDLKLDMPDFETEAEEAAWWPTQESKLFEAFKKAVTNGTLKRANVCKGQE